MRYVAPELTPKEANMLLFAAGSIKDDLNEYGLTEQDKRAWERGMKKLRAAIRWAVEHDYRS